MNKLKLTTPNFRFNARNLKATFLFLVLILLATKVIPDSTATMLLTAGTVYLAVSYKPKPRSKPKSSGEKAEPTPPKEG